MTDGAATPRPLVRLPTGVPGLDTVLRGGFLHGGLYLVTGAPAPARPSWSTSSPSTTSPPVAASSMSPCSPSCIRRMLMHLQTLSFFDPAPIGAALVYLSGASVLQEGGLSALLHLLQQAMRNHQASLVVLDGLATAQAAAESPLAFERFLQQLHAFLDLITATGVLVTPHAGARDHPEEPLVDGLLVLRDQYVGLRASRELEVRKFRGTDYLRGRHNFRITADGITVHPRTKSLLASPEAVAAADRVRLGFGVQELDTMLDGGLWSSSTTMVQGPPGSGKTLLGLHFLAAGARAGEAGLHFGFYETPTRLIDKAAQVGLDVSSFAADGRLEIVWQSPLEEILDALAERLLAAVRRRPVRRLFIDGLNGFQAAAIYPERLSRFLTALMHELRRLNITTLIAVETRRLESEALEVPITDLSAVVENILFLRYQEEVGQRTRAFSILKLRESAYDPTLREFTMTAQGIAIAPAGATPETAPAEPPRTPEAGPSVAGQEGSV